MGRGGGRRAAESPPVDLTTRSFGDAAVPSHLPGPTQSGKHASPKPGEAGRAPGRQAERKPKADSLLWSSLPLGGQSLVRTHGQPRPSHPAPGSHGGSGADPPCATSWRGEGDPQGPKAPLLSCRRRAEAQSRGHVSRKETLARRQGCGSIWGEAGVVPEEGPQNSSGFCTLTPLASLLCPQK